MSTISGRIRRGESLRGARSWLIKRRHFWRVYLHCMLLVLLGALAVGFTGILLRRVPLFSPAAERIASYLASRSTEIEATSSHLSRDLAFERDILGVEISIYRPSGALVASSHYPPLAPLPVNEALQMSVRPKSSYRIPDSFVIPVVSSGRVLVYTIIRPQPLSRYFRRTTMVLVLVLIATALGSIPLARVIAAPVEQLTQVAEELGRGDLSVRTGIRRTDEVGELARALDEMADRIEHLIRSEKELLANVSHELRTPISRIRVALELAAEGNAEQAQRRLIGLETDLDELELLVEDVLTTARLDLAVGKASDGFAPLRREKLEGAALLKDAAVRFRALHPAQPMELSIEENLPILCVDAGLLRRAIANLLDNARKYSDESCPITLVGRTGGDGLEILVCDRGIGIDAADLPKVFTPFFRSDRSRARKTGGAGLGLALVRRIVEAHQGRVSIESRPSQGTVVRIQLPAWCKNTIEPIQAAPL